MSLDAHGIIRLVTDLVNEDDVLCVALTCRQLREAIWARFPKHPTGHAQAGTRLVTRDRLAAPEPGELDEAAAGLDAEWKRRVDAALVATGDGILNLSDQPLGEAGARGLAAYLRLQDGELRLTELRLSETGLTAVGAGMVFGAFRARGCPGLKGLDVSENKGAETVKDGSRTTTGQLGSVGLASILAATVDFPALEDLNFMNCGVEDAGFEALATAMSWLPALKAIQAGLNDCDEDGAFALAAAVRSAPAPSTHLDMYGTSDRGFSGGNQYIGGPANRALHAAADARHAGTGFLFYTPPFEEEPGDSQNSEHDDY
jgi:hypothetical protein